MKVFYFVLRRKELKHESSIFIIFCWIWQKIVHEISHTHIFFKSIKNMQDAFGENFHVSWFMETDKSIFKIQ